MQNNKQENWVMALLLGVSAVSAYGSYHYYSEMRQINRIRTDVCGQKESWFHRLTGRGSGGSKLGQTAPYSVSQIFRGNQMSPIDQNKYHLISGIVLAHDEEVIKSGKDLSEYLRSMEGQKTIAKIIYKNELRTGNLSSTAGLQHLENRYHRENFWLVDNEYSWNISRDGANRNLPHNYTDQIDDKLLYVRLNPNMGAWQLPQLKKQCEEFSFAEKRASAHEIIRMQVQEGACLSVLGTISVDTDGNLQINNLIAIIAGGVQEVKKYLKKQSNHNSWSSKACLFISSVCFLSAMYCAYVSYENRKLERENEDALSTLHQRMMPYTKAEEMGTQCLICLINPSNVVLVPCNHLCMCQECYNRTKQQDGPNNVKCPICRIHVETDKQILIVYEQ